MRKQGYSVHASERFRSLHPPFSTPRMRRGSRCRNYRYIWVCVSKRGARAAAGGFCHICPWGSFAQWRRRSAVSHETPGVPRRRHEQSLPDCNNRWSTWLKTQKTERTCRCLSWHSLWFPQTRTIRCNPSVRARQKDLRGVLTEFTNNTHVVYFFLFKLASLKDRGPLHSMAATDLERGTWHESGERNDMLRQVFRCDSCCPLRRWAASVSPPI
eukprot:COSAG02_NODE_34_length_49821_cov_105.420438_20_plen_214_part_00